MTNEESGRGITTIAGVPVVTLETIKGWGPCDTDYRKIRRAYPGGVPVDLDAWCALHDMGVDVLWGAVRLLTDEERVELILFTLRQRQPHIVSLFDRAGLPDHARAIESLALETREDAQAAIQIFVAAWAAARGAAWGAAWDAAWAAAGGAAWDAAWDAAWAAAGGAAWDAARGAAWAAAGGAAWDAAIKDMLRWIYLRVTGQDGAR